LATDEGGDAGGVSLAKDTLRSGLRRKARNADVSVPIASHKQEGFLHNKRR